MTRLDCPVSCVEYSPDGEFLVVGFGEGKTSTGLMRGGDGSLDAGGGASKERREVKDDKQEGKSGWPRSTGGEDSNVRGELGAKTGGFAVLNETDFVVVFEARDARKVRLSISQVSPMS